MAGLTLTLARTTVLDFLDDPNGRRFNTAGDFAKIDRALQAALSGCLTEYVRAGGDVFDEEVSVTTSAAGLATLTSLVHTLRGVQVDTGDAFFSIAKQTRSRRCADDATARDLKVEFVRDFQVPTTTSHPLVGNGATAAPSNFRAFEDWVCAEAALRLAVTDNTRLDPLRELAGKDRTRVLGRLPDADGQPLPDDDTDSADWTTDLGFIFQQHVSAPTIQLVRFRGGW